MSEHPNEWVPGDRVTHPGKPEWGVGVVIKAQATNQNGRKSQRVEVRFARAGLKALSTAFARLERAPDQPAIQAAIAEAPAQNEELAKADTPARAASPSERRSAKRDQEAEAERLARLDPNKVRDIMSRLPESTRDPFLSLDKRLALTLDLYRFQPSGRSLLDWASVQSGLADPLSAFSRHELEQHFQRFRISLDNQVVALLGEARRAGLDPKSLAAAAPDAAKQALRRLIATR